MTSLTIPTSWKAVIIGKKFYLRILNGTFVIWKKIHMPPYAMKTTSLILANRKKLKGKTVKDLCLSKNEVGKVEYE